MWDWAIWAALILGAIAGFGALVGDKAELQRSVDRLRVPLARLAVLRAALDEAQDGFRRLTVVVPHG
jgi:hypothetical protein